MSTLLVCFSRVMSFIVAFTIFGSAVVPSPSYAATASFAITDIIDEALETITPTDKGVPDKTSALRCASSQGACVQMAGVGGQTVAVPKLEWRAAAAITHEEAEALIDGLSDPLNMTVAGYVPEDLLANFRSLRLTQNPDVKAHVMANVMREVAGPPIVFATYIPSDGSLHIEAVRTMRAVNGGIAVQMASITPYDFDLFKVTQAFATEEELRSGGLGRNPFDFAKSGAANDQHIFRNVSFDAARVAVGMAMRSTGAAYGVMTSSKEDWRTWTKKKKSGFLGKKIEYHTAADVESVYTVFTPLTTQGGGDNPVICADAEIPAAECPAALHAAAGVSSTQWLNGTFPAVKQSAVYHHMWSMKSSFNILKAIVIAVAVVVSAGYLGAYLAAAGTNLFFGTAAAGAGTGMSVGVGMTQVGAFLNTSFLGSALGLGSVVTASGVSFAATAAGVVQSVAYQAATWEPSFAKHSGVTDNHTLSLNDGLARGKTKYLKVPSGGLRQMARRSMTDPAQRDGMVPGGAVQMVNQRGNITPENHAERLVDFELSQ